ncbi:fido domain-containing protein [Hypoxylon argillaceum]|nr:fido domain-containing protein [Hypoxylon argillaceum]
MKESLHSILARSGSWPSWIEATKDGKGAPVNFSMHLADCLREEFEKHNLPQNPVTIIDSAKRTFASKGAHVFHEIWERIENEACNVIFGSNLIEDAGAGFDYTINLCRQIFRGDQVDVTDIDERSPEYAELLQDFKQRGKQIDKPTIIRTRREIIQHAQALSWAVDNMVLDGMLWTEEAVKTIHGILYAGMTSADVVPGEYRGRDHPIAAKYTDPKTGKEKVTRFIHPRAVPSYMEDWVKNLNTDIQQAESGTPFDPYDLSAKHYHHFINIHPFGDGNGRTSRIILNCLVMKFTGHLIPIGEDDKEKDEFLGIAVRGAKKYHEEDGEVDLDEQKGHREIAKLMARKSVKSLNGMWTWFKKYNPTLN